VLVDKTAIAILILFIHCTYIIFDRCNRMPGIYFEDVFSFFYLKENYEFQILKLSF